MPPRRTATLALIALIAAIALPVSPAPAQSRIDFGQAPSEDFLAGDGPAYRSGYSLPQSRRPDRQRRDDTRRWDARSIPRIANRYVHSSPSIAYVQRLPRSTYYRGTGIFANANPSGGSFIAIPPQGADGTWDGQASGPKFIDVASQRLDRQPVAAGGISVHYAGSSKIIRIAPDYRMSAARPTNEDFAALPDETPAAAYDRTPAKAAPERPAPMPEEREAWAPPAPEPAAPETAAPEALPAEPEPVEPVATAAEDNREWTPVLEPWTDEWLRDCVARYDNFDASLGTFSDENGRRRFCTGDPA